MIRLRLAYGGTGDTGTSRGENTFPDAQDFSKYFGVCFWSVLLFVLLLGSEPRPLATE